jgi:hypothetical protein
MPKKKTAVRNPWTKEDLRHLKAHSKARTPVVEIAMRQTEALAITSCGTGSSAGCQPSRA